MRVGAVRSRLMQFVIPTEEAGESIPTPQDCNAVYQSFERVSRVNAADDGSRHGIVFRGHWIPVNP